MFGSLKSAVLLFLFFSIGSAENVPLLIWSNKGDFLPGHGPILAGKTVGYDVFLDQYMKPVVNSNSLLNVVVFMMDQLSMSDITLSAGLSDDLSGQTAFPHLKSLMSSMPFAALPSVSLPSGEFPAEVMQLLPANSIKHVLHSPYQLSQLELSLLASNLIVVKLPSAKGQETNLKYVLYDIDDIIESVTRQLSGLSRPFIAIYTASSSKPHYQGGSEMPKRRGRQLLQTHEPAEQLFGLMGYVPSMFMMYADELIIQFKVDKTITNFAQVNCSTGMWKTDASQCHNISDVWKTGASGNCTVTMTADRSIMMHNMTDFNITVTVILRGDGYWKITAMSFTMNNRTSPLDVSVFDLTSKGYSYHCHAGLVLFAQKSGYSLRFSRFQMQAFAMRHDKRFDYYNDCMGFFSMPIWMALLGCAFFLLIIFIGTYMLASIQAVDRFDDPKKINLDIRAE